MKKISRRSFVNLMGASAAAGALAGCGTTTTTSSAGTTTTTSDAASTESKDVVTINFWMGVEEQSGPGLVVDAFNEEYKDKGIQVQYTRFVNDDDGNMKLETNLLAGGDVDVYVSYDTYRTRQRADSGMALNMSELMERDGFDTLDYFDAEAIEAALINGEPYSIYCGSKRGSIIANVDMFEAAGIDLPLDGWTYEEFRTACQKLTYGEGLDKVYGMFWNSEQNMCEYMGYLTHQYLGGDWTYTEDGTQCNYNDPHTVAASQLVYDTMNVDETAYTHADTVTQKLSQESVFLSGKCAMVVGAWVIRSVKNTEEYPHDFLTAYVPYPTEDENAPYCYGGYGDEISINPKSEHLDETWEFVKWYTTKGCVHMAGNGGGRMGIANTLDYELMLSYLIDGYEDIIHAESMQKALIDPPARPFDVPFITTKGSELNAILNEELEGAMNKQQTVQEALDAATERGNKLLDEA